MVDVRAHREAFRFQAGSAATITVTAANADGDPVDLTSHTLTLTPNGETPIAATTADPEAGTRVFSFDADDTALLDDAGKGSISLADGDGDEWIVGSAWASTVGTTSQDHEVSVVLGSANIAVTVSAAIGAGGGSGLPDGGTDGQVPFMDGDEVGWLSPNSANGYARLDGDGTVPDNRIPSTIARDSEVAAAVAAAVPPTFQYVGLATPATLGEADDFITGTTFEWETPFPLPGGVHQVLIVGTSNDKDGAYTSTGEVSPGVMGFEFSAVQPIAMQYRGRLLGVAWDTTRGGRAATYMVAVEDGTTSRLVRVAQEEKLRAITVPSDNVTVTEITASNGLLDYDIAEVEPSSGERGKIALPALADWVNQTFWVLPKPPTSTDTEAMGPSIGYSTETPGVLGDLATMAPTDLDFTTNNLTVTFDLDGISIPVTLTADYTSDPNAVGGDLFAPLLSAGATMEFSYYVTITGDTYTAAIVSGTTGTASNVEVTDAGTGGATNVADPLGLTALTSTPGDIWYLGYDNANLGVGEMNDPLAGFTHAYPDDDSNPDRALGVYNTGEKLIPLQVANRWEFVVGVTPEIGGPLDQAKNVAQAVAMANQALVDASSSGPVAAGDVSFDNTGTDLAADDVQSALAELDGRPGGGAWQVVSDQTLESNAASVTFADLGQYTEIEVRFRGASTTTAAGIAFLQARLNGDTGSNYHHIRTGGQFSGSFSARNGGGASAAQMVLGEVTGSQTNSDRRSTGVVTLRCDQPAASRKIVDARTRGSRSNDNAAFTYDATGEWVNTADLVSSLTLFLDAGDWVAGSRFEVLAR